MKPGSPKALRVLDAPPRAKPSNYPEPFASRMKGREKRPLGVARGAQSALRHAHTKQDEFIYVLQGHPTLVTDAGGIAHHLVNRSTADVLYLEIGDRSPGDAAAYPDDDLQAVVGADGKWRFARKDGTPY